jgi:hypothetical protein
MKINITTPEYIAMLLSPAPSKPQGRKVWSVDLETVWLPFFTASNVMGKTVIPPEALGAPLRLAYGKDGLPKFNNTSGKPVIRVAKELGEGVKMVRENFIANLQHFSATVHKADPEAYKAEITTSIEAGKPIREADRTAINKAVAEAMAEALAQRTETEAKAPQTAAPTEAQPELVTA